MIHESFPPVPSFRDEPNDTRIQQVALRVVVEFPGERLVPIGTGVLIAGNLAITARHVLDEALRVCKARQTPEGVSLNGANILLIQVLLGPVYNIFQILKGWRTTSDIAIVNMTMSGLSSLSGTSKADQDDFIPRVPILRAFPPTPGAKVLAFGYRNSKDATSVGADGKTNYALNDTLTTSAGVVGQIFPKQRESIMLNFPCFEVVAKFFPGMSGGVIVDEDGHVCGLVCSGLDFADPNATPLSYAATLWPMLTARISANRGPGYPRDVEYPVSDLARDRIIHVLGHEQVAV